MQLHAGSLYKMGEEIGAERPRRYFHTLCLAACHGGHKVLRGEVMLLKTAQNSVPVAQNYGAESPLAQLRTLLLVWCCW